MFRNQDLYFPIRMPFIIILFFYIMSSRRFEQILRNFNAANCDAKGAEKIIHFANALTENFRKVYGPQKELSTDESLMLYKGRLHFRQYIASKKARYGIKFYELTTSDGYVLNIIMYTGKDEDTEEHKKKLNKLC